MVSDMHKVVHFWKINVGGIYAAEDALKQSSHNSTSNSYLDYTEPLPNKMLRVVTLYKAAL